VHVLFTLLMFALVTAYRLLCEQETTGGEPVGWQRWRRQLLEQTRDKVIVFAQGYYGIFHLAEYSLLLGVKLKDVPPAVANRAWPSTGFQHGTISYVGTSGYPAFPLLFKSNADQSPQWPRICESIGGI
jgi:hypothetical protein